ncbi:hypothetical protein GMSM_08780 [Geomonas sp. Red276]
MADTPLTPGARREESPLTPQPEYIARAARMGLGVAEPKNIQLVEL